MTTYTERRAYSTFEQETRTPDRFEEILKPALIRFHSIARKTALFHLLFLALGAVEFLVLVLFLFPLADMHFVGIGVASLFFTVLLYFILRLYYEEQKKEQLSTLRSDYMHTCEKVLPVGDGVEKHVALAQACYRFVENLQDMNFYRLPDQFSLFTPLIGSWAKQRNFSTLLLIKELLLISAIEEHFKLIKISPCDAKIHAALGNAFLILGDLYKDPRSKTLLWLPQKMLTDMKQKRIAAIEHAIVEFQIVKEFAPSDPWCLSQLARSYLEIQKMHDAVSSYEEVIKLTPYDEVALFSLGKLYFKMGKNAEGLKIYDSLKAQNLSCAEELLSFYGDIVVQR